MSHLLISEPPLQVLPSLACRIGLHEAMVLQQVHYLTLRPSNRDGWVTKTHEEWGDIFPFFKRRTIERAFANLRQIGLLMTEPVPGAAGRRSRVKVDHDVLDAMTALRDEDDVWPGKSIRQSGGLNPPDWRVQSANLAGSIRQSGGSRLCKGTERKQQEELQDDASHRHATPSLDDKIEIVFQAWQTATGNTGAVLDANRRRQIAKALKSRPPGEDLADCVDAVKGWRHSAYHAGKNDEGVPVNKLSVLLRDADQIETFRDLERHRGDSSKLLTPSGNVAGPTCPGRTPGAELAGRWAPIAAGLAERVPQSTHAIWLEPLHPHADVDGTLIIGVPAEIASWVGDRFRSVLDDAAGDTPVTLVTCDQGRVS